MSFDTKKYPGYTEMLFKHRKSTLTRKKALATFLTSDEKEIQLYDFYNKYYFFMKFDGFDPMINIYDDLLFRAGQLDGVKEYYQKEFGNISLNEIEEEIAKVVANPQNENINSDYVKFCNDYVNRKGLDVPEVPEVKTECHLLGYDEDGRITYTPIEMEDDTEIQEEQNEIAPLSFNENAEDVVEEDEWAGFLPETNLKELKPQDLTPEDEATSEQASEPQEVTPNFKEDKKSKKSKKKSGKKKSKK